jgi:hypothetical protein
MGHAPEKFRFRDFISDWLVWICQWRIHDDAAMIADCGQLTWCLQRHNESSRVAFETRVDAHADIVTIAVYMRKGKKNSQILQGRKSRKC